MLCMYIAISASCSNIATPSIATLRHTTPSVTNCLAESFSQDGWDQFVSAKNENNQESKTSRNFFDFKAIHWSISFSEIAFACHQLTQFWPTFFLHLFFYWGLLLFLCFLNPLTLLTFLLFSSCLPQFHIEKKKDISAYCSHIGALSDYAVICSNHAVMWWFSQVQQFRVVISIKLQNIAKQALKFNNKDAFGCIL